MELMSFEDVQKKISKTKKNRKWHFLMGNGFSIAYSPSMFSYNALQSFVKEQEDEVLATLFDIFKTSNFELIMRQLDTTLLLAEEFNANKSFRELLVSSNQKLKNSLIDAIKILHPEHVFAIEEEKSQSCSDFLRTFLETEGEIFTTNYDLLMYWILMRNQIKEVCDGFGREIEFDDDEFSEEYEEGELIWGKHKDEQNIHYLHGTLPFFDSGISIVKEEYDGNFLLDKIKKRINKGDYPIFVTAGTGRDKLSQIRHNAYLTYCYDKLSNIDGSLVTYGFNFGEYDEHIIAAINKATRLRANKKLYSIYIGTYSEDDVEYIKSISDKFNCKVYIFDSKTADVWK